MDGRAWGWALGVVLGMAWAGAEAGPWRCVDAEGGTVLSDRAIGEECVDLGRSRSPAPTVQRLAVVPARPMARLSRDDESRIEAFLGAAPRCTDAVWEFGLDEARSNLACRSAKALHGELMPMFDRLQAEGVDLTREQIRLLEQSERAAKDLTAALREAQRR